MGGSHYCRRGDRRSGRKARFATIARRLLAGFPPDPDRSVAHGPVRAPGILRLVDEAHRYVHVAGASAAGVTGFRLVTSGYRVFMSELVENRNDVAKLQGVYVLHEASGLQRALYVGSTWGATFRARLTYHLMPGGSLRQLGRMVLPGVVALVDSGRGDGEADEDAVDRAMRRIVFGHNRWAAAGFARTREEEHAVDLISSGAFDVAYIILPERERTLAQFIEQRLVQVCRIECGQVPPLQRVDVRVAHKARVAASRLGVQVDLLRVQPSTA